MRRGDFFLELVAKWLRSKFLRGVSVAIEGVWWGGCASSRCGHEARAFILCFREQKLPTVPETLLKQRKKRDEVKKARAFAKQATKKVSSYQ